MKPTTTAQSHKGYFCLAFALGVLNAISVMTANVLVLS